MSLTSILIMGASQMSLMTSIRIPQVSTHRLSDEVISNNTTNREKKNILFLMAASQMSLTP